MQQVRGHVADLVERKRPLLAVCLGHQILSRHLGFLVQRKERPTQGVQEEVCLFGAREKVGFYNSFCPLPGDDPCARLTHLGAPEVAVRPSPPELLAFRQGPAGLDAVPPRVHPHPARP